jgi:riboflavin biosynthesis pyrimidine reductase
VAVLGEQVPGDYLAELREDGVSYLFAGPDGSNLHRAMHTLGEAFGVKTILLEGGGRINGAFLKARLIDEISLLVYPGIDGLAGVSSIFEFVGGADERPANGQSLRHTATETLEGGMVGLQYKVKKTVGGIRKNGDFARKKEPNKTSSSPRYIGLRVMR